MSLELRFVSGNDFKIKEVKEILNTIGIKVISFSKKIHEIQTIDEKELVRDKLLRAFSDIGRKLFVEHTGLYIEALNGFPGGLTQIFWDKLQADKFSEIFGRLTNTTVIAKTVIGYCDAKFIHFFEGKVEGKIVNEPRGKREFQWDCVFQPNGYDKTFAELGEQKNEISMRRLALNEFVNFLKQ